MSGDKRSPGIRLDAEIVDRARDAAVYLEVTLKAFVEDAITRSLRRIERREGVIPERERDLNPGRLPRDDS